MPNWLGEKPRRKDFSKRKNKNRDNMSWSNITTKN